MFSVFHGQENSFTMFSKYRTKHLNIENKSPESRNSFTLQFLLRNSHKLFFITEIRVLLFSGYFKK